MRSFGLTRLQADILGMYVLVDRHKHWNQDTVLYIFAKVVYSQDHKTHKRKEKVYVLRVQREGISFNLIKNFGKRLLIYYFNIRYK